jgi:proteasome accessory factor C
MNKLDKLYRLHHLLEGRRVPIPRADLLRELETSWPTLKRLVRDLRERFNAPIVPVRGQGYVYDPKAGKMFELPGLWFNAEELLALVTIDELLERLQPGLLDEQLAPLRARVEKLLVSKHLGAGEAARRIRILRMASRAGDLPHFQTAAGAVLQRKRLAITYFVRERNEETQREVSPQRLTHYRDNWYLDAWCHLRKALRSFAVECIRSARPLEARADDIPDADLDRHFASAYGIFAGQPSATAALRFTPERARWVADEVWHPEQQTRWLPDGRFELSVPYSDPRELAMDILKYGPDVEVVAPEALRDLVAERLQQAAKKYRRTSRKGSRFEPEAG